MYFLLVFTEKQELIFSAFSIYTNGLKLLETHSSNDDIDCLYGIRALSIMWIIHGHRVQTYFYFPIINRVQLHEVFFQTRYNNQKAIYSIYLFYSG